MTKAHAVRSIRRRGRWLFLPAAGSLVLTGALAAPAHSSASQPGTGIPGILQGVSAVSASDAWAVGSSGPSGTVPLIMHWDGQGWSRVKSPVASCGLLGVSMVSATDGWSVGNCLTSTGNPSTLILHWNGTRWSRVPSPSPGNFSYLSAVSMVSATDGWASGPLITDRDLSAPLLLHWDGTRWSRVPIARSVTAGIGAVSAASASEAWALAGQLHQAAALHWDGTSWSKVLLLPGDRLAVPFAVSDAGPKNAWAVGQRGAKTLTLHWNGTAWSQVPSPSPGQLCQPCDALVNNLSGVAIISKSDVWAVGTYTTSTATAALTLHWNGTKWIRVPNQRGTTDSALNNVSMVSATDGWAVGWDYNRPQQSSTSLILHWNGTTWSRS